ncbi:hypothetical protein M8J75_010678 [Diaphorina citri]|nr:hypothetical protein M8J75_010678 [Diaphorina citri]
MLRSIRKATCKAPCAMSTEYRMMNLMPEGSKGCMFHLLPASSAGKVHIVREELRGRGQLCACKALLGEKDV